MNWFERNLVHSQINKHNAQDDTLNKYDMNNRNDAAVAATKSSMMTNKPLHTLQLDAHQMNGQHLPDNAVVSEQPTIKAQFSPTTVIAVTKPPIRSEEITTQYAPAWKSLINKIVNSNKNELVDVNPIKNVDKAWSTVIAKLRATTNSIPIKTTLAPVQRQEDSRKFCFSLHSSVQLCLAFSLHLQLHF